MGIFKKDNSSDDLRQAGDNARDAKQFQEAEKSYRAYLDRHPDDAKIWVQLGHAVKEQRGPAEAVEFYRKSTECQPDDPDGYVHLAHALKNICEINGALEAFKKAEKLKPTVENRRELYLLGYEALVEEEDSSVYLSVQDLIGYLQAHQTLSGIQRVQAGIAIHAIRAARKDVRFIRTDLEDSLPPGSFWELDAKHLESVINYASGPDVKHDRLRKLLDECVANVSVVTPRDGDTLVLLGAFWGYGNTADNYAKVKAAGVKVGVYIYDLIPITHPEYCDAKLAYDFALSLSEICFIADFFLTISEFTATELKNFMKQYGVPDVPVQSIPLAHTLSTPSVIRKSWPKTLAEIEGEPFVLYVSTVEGRKNHLYVVRVWRALMEANVAVPHLVFVGRMGWRIDGLREELASSDNLDGYVHIVHDLTDVELSSLYDKCQFTAFTSFVEGWGLPVGESLIHGKPCIASNSSSIPEVGGDLIDYVDPLNLNDGVRIFRKLIEDDVYRAGRIEQIRTKFKPRTWEEVSHNFLDAVINLSSGVGRAFSCVPITRGEVLRLKSSTNSKVDLENYIKTPIRLLLSPSFYLPENFGSWMKGSVGKMEFTTDAPHSDIIIYLETMPAPWSSDCLFSFSSDFGPRKSTRFTYSELLKNGKIRVKTRTDKSGRCGFTIRVHGKFDVPVQDKRRFAVGLISIAYAPVEDVGARTEILDEMTFHQ